MASVADLSGENFFDEIGGCVTLVDFWAPWCSPCLMQGPIVERVAAQVGEKAKVAKVNVDEAPYLASRLGIRSIPTLIVFKDGAPVERFVGVTQKSRLVAAIEGAHESK